MWRALLGTHTNTHTRSISWTAAAAGQVVCVCVDISCSACVYVCVLRRRYQSCLCGPAKWQKNSPLTFPCLYWFTSSDLITSKSATVSAVYSPAAGKALGRHRPRCPAGLCQDKELLQQSGIGWVTRHGSKQGSKKKISWLDQTIHSCRWKRSRKKRRQVSSSMQELSVLITVSSVWRQTWVGFCWNLHEKSLGKKEK